MSTKWNLDKSHSEVQFKVKHMVISTVSGEFLDFDASAESQDDNFGNPSFEFTANIDSINTKNPQRDEHLKSDDFFNASEFPTLTFKGSELNGDKLNGEITIKGTTKPVSLDANFGGVITDPYGHQRAGFEFEGEINRKDFGLNWSATTETGGLVVADKVKLIVNLELIKQ
ncbi:YceI family protein [Moheibacter sediminis]|uniref:Polyisoprenoid-binding protein YceI n=1 Tax=Moheibacter sediminis TaxID=1434700 RepID=A0A1W2BVW6_9FLAO|nr:YceI family protein [Moheibacter sediminis]SMC77117.1 Polyisoprenoid-binding protein YceI [Moheibacter sediminis]